MPGLSSRVTVASHILAFLASRRDDLVASPELARSVHTTPVVVRRLIGALRAAGLVEVQAGGAGGARLARSPAEITLLDAYRAVEVDALFTLHTREPQRECSVGANIQGVLWPVFCQAQAAMETVLGRVTVEDIRESIAARIPMEGCR